MAFLLQTGIFVCNFYRKVNFCGKKLAVILFSGNLFLLIEKKPAKIAKPRTRKNLVLHGITMLLTSSKTRLANIRLFVLMSS